MHLWHPRGPLFLSRHAHSHGDWTGRWSLRRPSGPRPDYPPLYPGPASTARTAQTGGQPSRPVDRDNPTRVQSEILLNRVSSTVYAPYPGNGQTPRPRIVQFLYLWYSRRLTSEAIAQLVYVRRSPPKLRLVRPSDVSLSYLQRQRMGTIVFQNSRPHNSQ